VMAGSILLLRRSQAIVAVDEDMVLKDE